MGIFRLVVLGAAAGIVAGCASAPRSFPVAGETNTLAGVWQGEFTGAAGGRDGTIHFELKAGQDSAYGDVLMVSETWERGTLRPTEYPAPPVETPELLGVRFVQVSQNQVRGKLVPYHDPACDCMVSTVFEGTIKGDRIEGTYRTYYSTDAIPFTGKWKVKRVSTQLDPCINGNDTTVEREDGVEVKLRDRR